MPGITRAEVAAAAAELAKMRGSLAAWLRFRSLNDQVLAGTAPVRKPMAYAQRVVAGSRDMSLEQDLATKLHSLLEVVMPGASLPAASVAQNPGAAVQLAQIALMGGSSAAAGAVQIPGPSATGSIMGTGSHPWLWPVLIVGGLLLTVTTAIKTAADVAKDQEEKACIEAGACTDYGFWLKAGGIAALVYIAWKEMGLGDVVRRLGKGRS